MDKKKVNFKIDKKRLSVDGVEVKPENRHILGNHTCGTEETTVNIFLGEESISINLCSECIKKFKSAVESVGYYQENE